jgi:hypothetical protein
MADILRLKEYVICKTKPPSYFPCKINILWAVPFLQNWDDENSQFYKTRNVLHMEQSSELYYMNQY